MEMLEDFARSEVRPPGPTPPPRLHDCHGAVPGPRPARLHLPAGLGAVGRSAAESAQCGCSRSDGLREDGHRHWTSHSILHAPAGIADCQGLQLVIASIERWYVAERTNRYHEAALGRRSPQCWRMRTDINPGISRKILGFFDRLSAMAGRSGV